MVKTKKEIIQEIVAYIEERGADYSEWYVGIASNPKQRLSNDHNVKYDSICKEATSSDAAREVEIYFIEELGTDGGTGGGDDTTKFVYAYKKTSETIE